MKEWGPGRQAPNPGRAVQLETHKGPKCHRTIVCGAEDAMGYTPICKSLPDRCSNGLDHSMLPTTQLHHIRGEMAVNPIEAELANEANDEEENEPDSGNMEYISSVEPSTAWTKKRDDLARAMWAERTAM